MFLFTYLKKKKLGKGGKVKCESQDAEEKETWIKYMAPAAPGLIARITREIRPGSGVDSVKPTE